MKIQFAIINPDHIAENEGEYNGRSFMMGIAKTNEHIPDFELNTLVISQHKDGLASFFIPNQDNLRNRSSTVDFTSFEDLLTGRLWMQGQCDGCVAGDITYIAVPPIETDLQHEHHYLVMGMMTGPVELLKAHSGRILEIERPDFNTLPDLHQMVEDTGRVAEHKVGAHLNTLIEQPIWGFGDKKAGAAYSVTPQAAHKQFEVLREFAVTGVLPDGEAYDRLRSDHVQQNYIRRQHALQPMEYHYWETAQEKKVRREFALKALASSLNDPELEASMR
jgi:hypothetical protein